jgi:hypothetical protein
MNSTPGRRSSTGLSQPLKLQEPIVSAADPPTYTIPEFCRAHRVGRTYFYEVLLPSGEAPAITIFGKRKVITREAAA